MMADDKQTTETNGGNYTTRDLLARIEGKLDVVASKQQYVEVELALLKARLEETEKDVAASLKDSSSWRGEVRARIDHIDKSAEEVRSKQKATAYIVGALVIVLNLVGPFLTRMFL